MLLLTRYLAQALLALFLLATAELQAQEPSDQSAAPARRVIFELPAQQVDSHGVSRRETVEINLDQTALLLLDVWKNHERQPDDGWLDAKQTNIEQKIVPLLAFARARGLTIIHAPHRQEIADEAAPLPGEFVCNPKNPDDSQRALLPYLREHRITTLLYAGYTSNLCLLYRPVGILPMRALGYQTILLRDCTVPYVPKTMGKPVDNADKQARINAVEPLWGMTITLEDLRRALGE